MALFFALWSDNLDPPVRFLLPLLAAAPASAGTGEGIEDRESPPEAATGTKPIGKVKHFAALEALLGGGPKASDVKKPVKASGDASGLPAPETQVKAPPVRGKTGRPIGAPKPTDRGPAGGSGVPKPPGVPGAAQKPPMPPGATGGPPRPSMPSSGPPRPSMPPGATTLPRSDVVDDELMARSQAQAARILELEATVLQLSADNATLTEKNRRLELALSSLTSKLTEKKPSVMTLDTFSQLLKSEFTGKNSKRSTSGIDRIVTMFESLPVDIKMLEGVMREVASNRDSESRSSSGFFGKKPDHRMVDALYDLMSAPGFSLTETSMNEMIALLNPAAKSSTYKP